MILTLLLAFFPTLATPALAAPAFVAQAGQQPVPQTSITAEPTALAHVSSSVQFVVHAPQREIAPLFGAEGERGWAGGGWKPQFVFPQPAKDAEGEVFTIQHGAHRATWVNTIFDPAEGRVQYVYFIPDALVTVIDVKLAPVVGASTRVEVTYTRTALDAAANEHVRALAQGDREDVPQWRQAIEDYLAKRRK